MSNYNYLTKEKAINIGIIGAAGYTGGELIRLLLNHPSATITFATSRTLTGQKISSVHTDLFGETDLVFNEMNDQADVLFLCLPHKESRPWLAQNPLPKHVKIIDLGNDFRVDETFGNEQFVYGLPELQKDRIQNARLIANPGCFATAIQLALLPLAKEKLLQNVYTTGITGATGAGKGLMETTQFTWRNNNISAYKTLTHQHLGEIKKTLKTYHQQDIEVHFVPWRGDFPRGIFTSSIIESNKSLNEIVELYQTFYQDAAFTFVSEAPIDMKQVVNTNKGLIHIEKTENKIVVHTAIDNLLKGASGQAVQNMNLAFGFDEKAGLHLKPQTF
jgi:N-acetyl-gamma-glutamyl-phosphate reductase